MPSREACRVAAPGSRGHIGWDLSPHCPTIQAAKIECISTFIQSRKRQTYDQGTNDCGQNEPLVGGERPAGGFADQLWKATKLRRKLKLMERVSSEK